MCDWSNISNTEFLSQLLNLTRQCSPKNMFRIKYLTLQRKRKSNNWEKYLAEGNKF